jgi:hypothetical protein
MFSFIVHQEFEEDSNFPFEHLETFFDKKFDFLYNLIFLSEIFKKRRWMGKTV